MKNKEQDKQNSENLPFGGGFLFCGLLGAMFPSANEDIKMVLEALKGCIDDETVKNFDNLSEEEKNKVYQKVAENIEKKFKI